MSKSRAEEAKIPGYDVENITLSYYIILQAVNRAGLSSHFAFYKFGVDRSPPTGGHVMDGFAENVSVSNNHAHITFYCIHQ